MRRRATQLLASLIGFTIALAPAISRAQSAYGPTGLLVHPTAFVEKPHSLSAYLSTYSSQTRAAHGDWAALSLNYGISDKAEAGPLFVYHRTSTVPAHTHEGLFAKYQLFPDTSTRPAFALVASYLHHDNLETVVSGVFSHTFRSRDRRVIDGHIGVKYARAGHDLDFADAFAGFIGAEIPLGTRLNFIAEAATRLSFEPYPASALGLSYEVPGGGAIRIGVVGIGRSTDDRFFFGVGYPLGGVK